MSLQETKKNVFRCVTNKCFVNYLQLHVYYYDLQIYINTCGCYRIKSEENIPDIEETKGTIASSFFAMHSFIYAIAILELFQVKHFHFIQYAPLPSPCGMKIRRKQFFFQFLQSYHITTYVPDDNGPRRLENDVYFSIPYIYKQFYK